MKFRAASDQAVLVYLGEEIGLETHGRVLKLLRALESRPPKWLRNVQPAYCSLLVTFDACVVDHGEVEATLAHYEKRAKALRPRQSKRVEIPVCYGGEFGPDLAEAAHRVGLKPEKFIKLHASRTYHAYFLGFAPGFAYLGDVPDEIAVPRLETPRKQVPPGSVGIAGKQTAVYPFATPGGWVLIGRSPVSLFKKGQKAGPLISIGDEVRFVPISREEYEKRSRV